MVVRVRAVKGREHAFGHVEQTVMEQKEGNVSIAYPKKDYHIIV